MRKNKIIINEAQLNRIIRKSVYKVLNEGLVNTDEYGQKSMFGINLPWTKKTEDEKGEMRRYRKKNQTLNRQYAQKRDGRRKLVQPLLNALQQCYDEFKYLAKTDMNKYAEENGLENNQQIMNHIDNNQLNNGWNGDYRFLPGARAASCVSSYSFNYCCDVVEFLMKMINNYADKFEGYTSSEHTSLDNYFAIPYAAWSNPTIQERAKLFGDFFTRPFKTYFKVFEKARQMGIINLPENWDWRKYRTNWRLGNETVPPAF